MMFSIVIGRFQERVWYWGKLIFVCGMWNSVISTGTSVEMFGTFVRILTHTTWYSSFQVENFFSDLSVNLCICLG